MTRQHSFLTLVLILTFTGLALGNYLEKSGKTELRAEYLDELTPRPQKMRERAWADSSYTPLWSLGGEETPVVFGPFYGKIDPAGNLFVVDYGDTTIKKISPRGELLCTCGAGRGQGPGELSNVTGLSFSAEGVWVADASNGRVLVFDEECQARRTIRTPVQPYHLATGEAGEFVMLSVVRAENLFGVYSTEGEVRHSFGRLLQNQAERSLTLDGWIESDPRSGFVYTGLHASLIASYSPQGTLDPKPLPKLVRDQNRMWIDRQAEINAQSLSVTTEGIHTLTVIEVGLQNRGAIDTYALEDGSYKFSRRLPEPSNRVLVGEDGIFTITATTITKWSAEPTSDISIAG